MLEIWWLLIAAGLGLLLWSFYQARSTHRSVGSSTGKTGSSGLWHARGVELGLEELAARVPHVSQLEKVGGGKQRLDIVLGHINLALYNVNTKIT